MPAIIPRLRARASVLDEAGDHDTADLLRAAQDEINRLTAKLVAVACTVAVNDPTPSLLGLAIARAHDLTLEFGPPAWATSGRAQSLTKRRRFLRARKTA